MMQHQPPTSLSLTVIQGNKSSGAAVLIVPSAFGVAADLVEQMQELAQAASIVCAIDPFADRDPGPAEYTDMPRVMARLQSLDREQFYGHLREVISWLRAQTTPSRPVVFVGVCFGGPFALLAAADHLVDAVVTWHGSRMDNFLDRASAMQCPMRLHFGAVDPFVTPVAVQAIRAALESHANVQFFVHEGATHGFSHRSAAKAYNAAAEQSAMASVKELLATLERVEG